MHLQAQNGGKLLVEIQKHGQVQTLFSKKCEQKIQLSKK